MAKTKFDIVYDDSVPGGTTDIKMSAIIPSGRVIQLQSFGGCTPDIGDGIDGQTALQWGSGTSWQTIRAGTKSWDMLFKKDFLGDGSKRFRLVRKNNSTTSRPMVVWLEALVL